MGLRCCDRAPEAAARAQDSPWGTPDECQASIDSVVDLLAGGDFDGAAARIQITITTPAKVAPDSPGTPGTPGTPGSDAWPAGSQLQPDQVRRRN